MDDKYLMYDWDQILHTLGILGSFKKRESGVLVGLCVFHKEVRPSLLLYPLSKHSSKHYHCYGCGAHGSLVEFVSEYKGISDNQDLRKEDLEKFFAKISVYYGSS